MPGIFRNSRLWNKLIGGSDEFSMDHRAFNYICIVTGILLVLSFFVDLYIEQYTISFVIVVLFVLLSVLYYFSRFKLKYRFSVIFFVISTYAALALNYFENAGINGPTLSLSLITLLFASILTKPKYHVFFISLHAILFATLLSVEYIFPDTVPQTYPDRLSRFLDWGTTGIITLVFVYTVSNFLRQYYDEKRLVADERAKAIENQNKVLEKVNTEKDKIFSIISHDLKAPLDSIQDYLTLLSEFALENDDRIKIETELLEQTKYTSDLLSNLMQWARSQVNGISPQIIGIVLADFLNDVVSRKQQIASKKKINITCDIPKDIIVACDFDLLQIIIRNLINNGIKFTPFGGTINISAHISASEGVISITDTGIGIAEDQQSDLFTLRTRSTYGTNNEKGIGIGLYICNEFVNAQGGRLWVESVVGNGSTFNVALPLITKI